MTFKVTVIPKFVEYIITVNTKIVLGGGEVFSSIK